MSVDNQEGFRMVARRLWDDPTAVRDIYYAARVLLRLTPEPVPPPAPLPVPDAPPLRPVKGPLRFLRNPKLAAVMAAGFLAPLAAPYVLRGWRATAPVVRRGVVYMSNMARRFFRVAGMFGRDGAFWRPAGLQRGDVGQDVVAAGQVGPEFHAPPAPDRLIYGIRMVYREGELLLYCTCGCGISGRIPYAFRAPVHVGQPANPLVAYARDLDDSAMNYRREMVNMFEQALSRFLSCPVLTRENVSAVRTAMMHLFRNTSLLRAEPNRVPTITTPVVNDIINVAYTFAQHLQLRDMSVVATSHVGGSYHAKASYLMQYEAGQYCHSLLEPLWEDITSVALRGAFHIGVGVWHTDLNLYRRAAQQERPDVIRDEYQPNKDDIKGNLLSLSFAAACGATTFRATRNSRPLVRRVFRGGAIADALFTVGSIAYQHWEAANEDSYRNSMERESKVFQQHLVNWTNSFGKAAVEAKSQLDHNVRCVVMAKRELTSYDVGEFALDAFWLRRELNSVRIACPEKSLLGPALFKILIGIPYRKMLYKMVWTRPKVALCMLLGHIIYDWILPTNSPYRLGMSRRNNQIPMVHVRAYTTCVEDCERKPARPIDPGFAIRASNVKCKSVRLHAPFLITRRRIEVFNQCTHNFIWGCQQRIGLAVPPTGPAAWRGPGSPTHYFGHMVFAMFEYAHREHCRNVVEPLPFEEWVARFSGGKRNMYQRLHDYPEPCQSPPEVSRGMIKIESFTVHTSDPCGDPRVLQPGLPQRVLVTGPWITALAKTLRNALYPDFSHVRGSVRRFIYTCGLNAEQVGDWFYWVTAYVESVMEAGDNIVHIMDDQSRYDAHMRRDAFRAADAFYTAAIPDVSIHLRRRPGTYSVTTREAKCSYDGPEMQSGREDTSCTDTGVNEAMKLSVYGVDEVWFTFVCGDDSLTVTTRRTAERLGGADALARAYAALGMTAKVKVVSPECSEFCSSRFVHYRGSYVLLPKMGRMLPKILVDCESRGMRKYTERLRSVATTLRMYGKYDPLARSLAVAVGNLYGFADNVTFPDWKCAPVPGGEPDPLSESLNYQYFYGVPATSLVMLSDRLSSLRLGDQLEDPVLDHIALVDH